MPMIPPPAQFPTVDVFADLPDASTNQDVVYRVRQKTGSTLTFNLRDKGFYVSDGSVWELI